ncbi:MAG: hypothetical protein H7A33_08400 [Deltaproteobacteria bacterium]|nr:hypothetical protein [Deltaproteobacteria bacterium]
MLRINAISPPAPSTIPVALDPVIQAEIPKKRTTQPAFYLATKPPQHFVRLPSAFFSPQTQKQKTAESNRANELYTHHITAIPWKFFGIKGKLEKLEQAKQKGAPRFRHPKRDLVDTGELLNSINIFLASTDGLLMEALGIFTDDRRHDISDYLRLTAQEVLKILTNADRETPEWDYLKMIAAEADAFAEQANRDVNDPQIFWACCACVIQVKIKELLAGKNYTDMMEKAEEHHVLLNALHKAMPVLKQEIDAGFQLGIDLGTDTFTFEDFVKRTRRQFKPLGAHSIYKPTENKETFRSTQKTLPRIPPSPQVFQMRPGTTCLSYNNAIK